MSGLAVDLGRRWLLVDCGEGTQHQVLRSPLTLHRLSAVLITHLHGDHVLGLPGLLGTMGLEGRTEPLMLAGPDGLRRWIEATSSGPMLSLDFPLEIVELTSDGDLEGTNGQTFEVTTVERVRVTAMALRHRVPTFGYRLVESPRAGVFDAPEALRLGVPAGPDFGRLQRGETVRGHLGDVVPRQVIGASRPGRVVTVFGDTTPCANAVKLAARADLVVHEATYANDAADLAEQWRHSTAADAAEVARAAGARRLLITHFSSRYDEPDRLVADARARFAATDAAGELQWFEVPFPDPSPA